MNFDDTQKEVLKRSLHATWSHPDPFDIIRKTKYEVIGEKVEGLPFTIWQISRHMMEWAFLIVNRLNNKPMGSEHEESNFYPPELKPELETNWNAHQKAWDMLEVEVHKLLDTIDPNERIPEWDNSTFHDALMILLSHNSYHTAQIVMMRRLLGDWK